MAGGSRVYLDNAATSWPKPDAVCEAMDAYARQVGAPAGRSAYRHAAAAERLLDTTRSKVARVIEAPDVASVVFAYSGTDALNTAIHGCLRPGDHVVTSEAEHNSVLRPLMELRRRMALEVTYVPVDGQGRVSAGEVIAAVLPHTRLVALTHVSNVTGTVQPVEEIGRQLAELPTLFLVDAAQSLGHRPVSVRALGADLLAAPGHKGLLGPLGTGILYIRREIAEHVRSFRQGGTGTLSEQEEQPEGLPYKYEAGNHNLNGIAGLGAALDFLLEERSIAQIQAHEQSLTRRLRAGLREIAGIRLIGDHDETERAGVVSLTAEGYEPQEFAALLDATAGVQVRAGLHCAPRMHHALGTLPEGGTVRFSVGHANTPEQIDVAIDLVQQLMSAAT